MNRKAIIFCIFLTYFIFAILLNSVGTVILQVIRNYDVSKISAADLEPCKDLPIALMSFLCAAFLPRVGFRRSMIIGLSIIAVASIVMPLVPGFLMTKLLFVAVGVSFALVKVSCYSTIGLISDDRQKHVALVSTMEGVFMIGVLAGYWLFSYFIGSSEEKSDHWLNVYWILSALSVIAILILLVTPFDESGAKQDDCNMLQLFVAKWKLLGLPLTIVFVVSAFLYVLIEQGVGTWLPTFNHEVLHLPSDMSVQAASIFAGCLAAGRLSAGVLMQRFNWYMLLNICVVAMGGLILISMPLTRGLVPNENMNWLHAPAAAYIFPLIGLFMAPIYPTINSVILSALPKQKHAAMTGLIVVFSALGGTTGSKLIGHIFEKFDGQTAFYLSLIPLTGLLLSLFLFRRQSETYVHEEHPNVKLPAELTQPETN